ncbi:MAG: GNAT family N-acetyltransferase [Anaerolineales bacterium]|jgi:GNAT superfamily N-acetyltransferase
MTVSINLLTSQRVLADLDQITDVYREAFRPSPYHKREGEVVAFARAFPEHTQREGFRFVAASESDSDCILGFAYGYTTHAGQWWNDSVANALKSQIAEQWLLYTFQLAEIAVRPKDQGHGIGGRLHDHLLNGLPHRRAVLSTLATETVAYRLYHKRGWVILLDDYSFPGVTRSYRIMGLNLETCGSDFKD